MTFIVFVILYFISWAMIGCGIARRTWLSDYVDCKDGGSGDVEWGSGDLIPVEVGVDAILEVVEASGEFIFSYSKGKFRILDRGMKGKTGFLGQGETPFTANIMN